MSFVSYRKTSEDVAVNLTGYAVEAPLLNSAGTRIGLGASFPIPTNVNNAIYELTLFAPPQMTAGTARAPRLTSRTPS